MNWREALAYCALNDDPVWDSNGDSHWIEVDDKTGQIKLCTEGGHSPFHDCWGPYSREPKI